MAGEYAAASRVGRKPTWPFADMRVDDIVIIEPPPLLELMATDKVKWAEETHAFLMKARSAAHSHAHISGRRYKTALNPERTALHVLRVEDKSTTSPVTRARGGKNDRTAGN